MKPSKWQFDYLSSWQLELGRFSIFLNSSLTPEIFILDRLNIYLQFILFFLCNFIYFSRFRLLRQPGERASSHPSDERFPDRHEASEGPTEEAEGREQTLLTFFVLLPSSWRVDFHGGQYQTDALHHSPRFSPLQYSHNRGRQQQLTSRITIRFYHQHIHTHTHTHEHKFKTKKNNLNEQKKIKMFELKIFQK